MNDNNQIELNTETNDQSDILAGRKFLNVNMIRYLFITLLFLIIVLSLIFLLNPKDTIDDQSQGPTPFLRPSKVPTVTEIPTLIPTTTPIPIDELSDFYEQRTVNTQQSEESLNELENLFDTAETIDLEDPQDYDLDL